VRLVIDLGVWGIAESGELEKTDVIRLRWRKRKIFRQSAPSPGDTFGQAFLGAFVASPRGRTMNSKYLILCFLFAAPVFGEEPPNEQLRNILIPEAKGQAIDRKAALASQLQLAELPKEIERPKVNDRQGSLDEKGLDERLAIRWQSGDLMIGNEWKSVTEIDEATADESLLEYLKLRGDENLDIDRHREMARWCESKGLSQRARSHWFGVLDADPSDIEARKGLGFVFVFNRWVSPQEIAKATATSKSIHEALKKWMPRVRDWSASIEGTDNKKRLKAIEQLRELTAPEAIVALDVAVGQVSPITAKHFINAIGKFQTREASLSLAGIAIANTSTEVGTAAIESLKKYPLECYVPDLLDLMCTEFELKNQLVTRSNGELVLQLVQMRELRDKYQSAQVDKLMTVGNTGKQVVYSGLAVERIGRRLVQIQTLKSTKTAVKNEVAASIAAEEAKRNAEDAQAEVIKANESVRMLQSSIATVLRGTTGVKLDDSPKAWWDWWDRHEESYNAGEKVVESSYSEDRSSLVYDTRKVESTSYSPPVVPRRHECLVFGTLIQTERGLKPIESIRVGDMVVTQNIQSGELRLKPVLRTTLRPASATQDIQLASGEKIRATLGHPWWVIGQGWVKTKDLKKGMALRTPADFTSINDIEDREAIETFNLVIDDDHTYFVGQSRVLAWDATELIPTFQRVPGLPAPVLREE